MVNLVSVGTKMKLFLNKQELYMNRKNKNKLSFDTNDFDISFVRGLNLEDGVATLTDFTANIIGEELQLSLKNLKENIKDVLLCEGVENKILIKIKENLASNINFKNLDDFEINGDFVESQLLHF